MPAPIHTESVREVPFPPEKVWPVLSKTDWINRALGLPPIQYEIRPLPEGGSAVIAQAKFFGLQLRWQEIPFEWLENEFYCVHRVFERGPIAEGNMGVRFVATNDGKTQVRIFSEFTPRTRVGAWIIRRVLAPKSERGMIEVVEHVAKYLGGRKSVALPKLPKKPVSESALIKGLAELRAATQDASLVGRIDVLLRESPDVELSHIRPFALARMWRCDRWEVLRLFLHATRCGLLDFRWEVLCPNCRSTREPKATSLGRISKASHCEVCQIKFDAEFDKSVELKFSVNANVRPSDAQTFCLAGPGGKPHIFSQLQVGPKQSRSWKFPKVTEPVCLRSPQVKNPVVFKPDDLADPRSTLVIDCHAEKFELERKSGRNADGPLLFQNPNPFTVQLILERTEWTEDILTAAQVTSWQEFRDLFVTEVISPDEQITVGSQIVLFTDLRGSTAMYNGIGDAPAYVVVRDHFAILTEAIREHHGAIVKTIGDAVMAVFSRMDEALSAVRQMHERLGTAIPTSGLPAPLMLKSSLHLGPCLAVNANDKLDYFGTTVNLAARMVGCCQGGDLTISNEVHSRTETTLFLEQSGKSAQPLEVQFKGFEKPARVWRIALV